MNTYSRRVHAVGCACLLSLLFWAGPACGQWFTETFHLSNGWNAVYLRGTPWPADLDTQFASLPVRAVHRSYLRYDTAQFSGNLADLVTRGTEWVVWYPPASSNRVLTTLWNLGGNNAYMIECTANCTWSPRGVPVIPYRIWLPGEWNFAGLPVTDNRPVTFTEYFADAIHIDVSPDPAGGKVFRTRPNGQQQDITSQTAIMPINPKEGYWIMTQGLSDFIGTLFAHATMGSLRFPPNKSINSFTIRNERAVPQAVSVTLVASEAPPPGAPPRMGDVPLLHFAYSIGQDEWVPVTAGTPLTKTLASNEQWTVVMAVDRSAMSPTSDPEATWQSILEVRDEGGTLIRIPVVAEYGTDNPYDALWPAGLWVGEVTLDKVTQLAEGQSADVQPTSGTMAFRLILHVGADGQTRLLQQAILEWSELVSSGITNGFYRLRTDDDRVIPGEDNQRVSSVGFPYGLNVPMTGDLLQEVDGSFVVHYDAPANPFRHFYHPNHDNRDVEGGLLGEGLESYTVTNEVRLVADSLAPYTASAGLWSPEEELTGQYVQTMYGLRREAIRTEGRFSLRRVNRTGVLE